MNDAAPIPTFRSLALAGELPTLTQTIEEGLGIIASESFICGPDYTLERDLGDLRAREIVRLQALLEEHMKEYDEVVKRERDALRRVQAALQKAGNH